MKLLIVVCFAWMAGSAFCATYYIRTDGGTAAQCDGKTDAPFSGSGGHCAWKHPFYSLNGGGRWKIHGGDTLLIHNGSYMLGFGAPNTAWCARDSAYDCHLPVLPSGPDAAHPTRIVGAGWDMVCANPPVFWGTQRASVLVNLEGTSNASIQCLELTDHSGCVEFHSNPSVACKREGFPFGDWASIGIYAQDSSSVVLKNLNVHGFASTGIQAGRISNWSLTSVRIAGNGLAGWDGDIPGDDNNTGMLLFRNLKVEWNGCAETYPGRIPDHCWAQSAGGYGDGLGTGATGGHWIFENSTFRYNTSDGLDLLYVGRAGGGSIEIRRTVAIGNAGNQIKLGTRSTIVNSLLVGNCGFFYQKSFSQEMGSRQSGDHCRAAGNTLALSLHAGDQVSVVNSTIVGQGDVLVEMECDGEPPVCNGTEIVTLKNDVFRGYQDFLQPTDRSAFTYDPPGLSRGTRIGNNMVFGAKNSRCSPALKNWCANPGFVSDSISAFDGRLQQGSPAIDRGLPVGALNGLVPANDLTGALRPQGPGVDLGCFERPQ